MPTEYDTYRIAAQEDRKNRGSNGWNERGDRQKVVHYFVPPVMVTHVTSTAIPITMAKA